MCQPQCRADSPYSGAVASSPNLALPPAALEWLVGAASNRVLTLNLARSVIHAVLSQGNDVLAVESDPLKAAQLATSYRGYPQITSVIARADYLPVQPCTVKVALVGNWLNSPNASPVNEHLAHGQISRALDHDGWVAGWNITRDDSVPWVQHLLTLLRSVDPTAMSGGPTTSESVLTSKYFPIRESSEFRLWVPISAQDMSGSIAVMPKIAALAAHERCAFMAEVDQIFANAAGFSELRLPYRIDCWRAMVDHAELTTPITIGDGALVIPI